MVNVELSLADTIVVEQRQQDGPSITIAVTGESPPGTPISVIENPETSSLGRAFHLFCSTFATRARIAVAITKRIPNGAGLGGGTADAAALLRWCWERLLSAEQRELPGNQALLAQIAGKVGADVPYSLSGGCALVTGIGEVITPLSWGLSCVPVILVVPPVSVATPAAFAAYRAAGQRFSRAESEGLRSSGSVPPSPADLVKNDLEAVVAVKWSPVGEALLALRGKHSRSDATCIVGMTGSGSTLFCVPPSWSTAHEASQALERFVKGNAPEGCTIIPCRIR